MSNILVDAFILKSKNIRQALARVVLYDVIIYAEVTPLHSSTWLKMAANVELQPGHRPGVYKQKNKVHKHGKHRTKGEIERENKGKVHLELQCCL